jgi:hypothetical protein
MIDHARYFKGAHILKFHQGLNAVIQNHVACMTAGHPSDKTPKEWYNAALLCDENCIVNKAFRALSWTTPHPEKALYPGGMFRQLPVRAANMVPPISQYAPPIASGSTPSCHTPPIPTISTPMHPRDTIAIVCF